MGPLIGESVDSSSCDTRFLLGQWVLGGFRLVAMPTEKSKVDP